MAYVAIEGIEEHRVSMVFSSVLHQLTQRGFTPTPLRPKAPLALSAFARACGLIGRCEPRVISELINARRSNQAAMQVSRRARFVLGEFSVINSYIAQWDCDEPERGMQRVDRREDRIPLPTHVVFLNAQPALAAERLRTHTNASQNQFDESLAELLKARHLFRHLMWQASRYGLHKITWHVVNAERPFDEIVEATRKVVEEIVLFTNNRNTTFSAEDSNRPRRIVGRFD